ncbi:hypothetical protein N0V88_001385 [Collariella sp. IMI 366227]|nr:hypothetical protein N0V88_001385 [Collariella sp. IMI 366227]
MPRKLSEPQDPSIRTVSVRCRGNTVILQVDKQTTVDDFLQSCAQEMEKAGRPINPNTSVVIEPCLRPGLERRLRRYELVWDVLNTWEPDSFNTLIVSPDSSDPDGELILATVPDTLEEPDGFILPLYVFQRPGKWSVRYVTLKSNGQIYASKKKDSKPGDKDMVRLCHLSDFDLYMPTEAEMRKQLRPPKRYCYAVRSQERASLFVDNNHYVQYVCTEDPNVARVFRAGVQGWRSWYLVNKKLRLYDPEEVVSPTNLSAAAGFRGLVENNPAVFASGGLLGNGYDERRQQTTRKENVIIQQRGRAMSMKGDGPFVDGPNLLNTRAAAPPVPDSRPQTSSSDEHTRSAAPEGGWFPSAVQHSAEQRSAVPSLAA